MSTYLYGVVRGDHPREISDKAGVGSPGGSLRTVETDGLVAVVSDAPDGLRAKRRDLLAHEEVLETLCAQGATLPMRFGVVGEDDEAVGRELARKSKDYGRLLTELDGRTEINVKAKHHQDAVLRQVLLDDEELRRHNDQLQNPGGGSYEQRLRFGEEVAQAVQSREAQDAETIANLLRGHTVQERGGPAVDGCFLNTSFLLADSDVPAFQAAVERIRGELDWLLELRVHGPLPPYSFTESPQS